jgi:hypothetical protein
MSLKKYINEEVLKFHKQIMLETELNKINEELSILNEEEGAESKVYESNIYEAFKKDLEEVVKHLTEACNTLESASLKQDKHMTGLPGVQPRIDEAQRHKAVLLEIYKTIKRAKLETEKKLYEMQ